MAVVAIVGRPNVGKSTLFNRLVGKRLAIVDDTPGVTRDRREGEGRIADLRFRVIDTAGFEDAADDSLEARMRRQTERAITEADVALLLIDARAGVTPLDERFASLLRKGKTPILLAANKCEGRAAEQGLLEAYSLGLGEPIPLSAEHGEGLSDLYDALQPHVEGEAYAPALEAPEMDVALPEDMDEDAVAAAEAEAPKRPLQLAIVGRPNVGKSTLINRYLGEDRLLTGPEAGITRDSIAVDWTWKGREVRLVDTAGLRKRARVSGKIERLSAADTRRAIDFAEVVVLLLDARDMLEKQDLTIARQVIDEGRALIVAANKWDAVDDKPEALQKLKDRLEFSLAQLRGVPVVTMSALTGRNLDPFAGGGLRDSQEMERAGADREAEPMARSGRGAASPAAVQGPSHQDPLYDPGEDPPPDLRAVRVSGGQSAGVLSAILEQRVAGGFRPRRRAVAAERAAG
jgi:GTP-binding protein